MTLPGYGDLGITYPSLRKAAAPPNSVLPASTFGLDAVDFTVEDYLRRNSLGATAGQLDPKVSYQPA